MVRLVRPLRPLLVVALLCACGPQATAPTTTAPGGTTAPPSAEGSSLDAEIAKAATGTDSVFKMKIRLDAQGRVVKQSVYHRDAAMIPEPVRALAQERFPSGKADYYETEWYAEHGHVYEVEVDDGGTRCEVAATTDGKELYTECRLDPATLDPAVTASIETLAPGGQVLEAERKTGPERDEELWIEVRQGEGELYLRLRPDGTLIEGMRRIPAIVEVPLR